MCKWTSIVGLMLASAPLGAAHAAARAKERSSTPTQLQPWLGEEMPLPLTVRTPDDLTFKHVAERQFLLFNLLASGKLAYDRGDMATAAAKWETLLRVPDLPPDLERTIRPLAQEARQRAGGVAQLPPAPSPITSPLSEQAPSAPRTVVLTTVRGVVTGGGGIGAGGSIVWLKRVDGETPRPRPTVKTVIQKSKTFIPRVLAVPVGSTVSFRNDDEVFHNVFSLSHANEFDLGLRRQGLSREQSFRSPGPVDLLCNIHSSMSAYIYVVDSPYYAQADRGGNFTIRGVPPGRYSILAWHETSLKPTEQRISVKDEPVEVAVTVTSDRPIPAFVPDKAGKPRQSQLGY